MGGWAESGVNPAEYSRMLMRVACAYIEGADVRAVSSLDSWQSTPCASLSSVDLGSISSADGGSSSDGSSSGRDPAAAVAVVNPRKALDTAHKFTKLPGSATACVVQLCPEEKQLVAASLVGGGWLTTSAACAMQAGVFGCLGAFFGSLRISLANQRGHTCWLISVHVGQVLAWRDGEAAATFPYGV